MEKMKVRDLMVSADSFPKISCQVTFYEALAALEDAQKKYLSGEIEQRILLIVDKEGKVMGKLSPIDLIRGLETNYNRVNAEKVLDRFGLHYVWKSMQEDYNLWENPFKDLCRKAGEVQVKDFIKAPAKGQSVNVDDSLSKCFHLFVMNRHDALFVFDRDEIVGLLRFSDLYRKASAIMRECGIEAMPR
ncbi:MAG: CBS domain-containing protein [Desulfobacterales bacterium]|jgi:Mg2+/Co2+ transporter CorC|nr:CBS domain-containing protein [Desulfobacterales bacterium]